MWAFLLVATILCQYRVAQTEMNLLKYEWRKWTWSNRILMENLVQGPRCCEIKNCKISSKTVLFCRHYWRIDLRTIQKYLITRPKKITSGRVRRRRKTNRSIKWIVNNRTFRRIKHRWNFHNSWTESDLSRSWTIIADRYYEALDGSISVTCSPLMSTDGLWFIISAYFIPAPQRLTMGRR